MRYHHMLIALLVAGCTSGEMPSLESSAPPKVPTASCEGRSASQCKFINSPVKLSSKPLRLPDSPYPFFKTRNTLEFVNAEGKVWIAPAGILTDGASIPPMFVGFIGDPRSKEFMNAATVHDSYCAESNRNNPYYHAAPWQEVHRMFYDALRVSGTPAIKAKIMYAAVYLGGPRWKGVRKVKAEALPGKTPAQTDRTAVAATRVTLKDGLTITAAGGPGLRSMQSDVPLPKVFSDAQLIEAFKKAKSYIEENNPPIDAVEIHLTRIETDLFDSLNPRKRNFKPKTRSPEDYLEDMRGDGDSGGTRDTDRGYSRDNSGGSISPD